MYPASTAFHNAVDAGAHQIALMIFDDAVFTNDDIDVNTGIEFTDYFNAEEDLAIGQAISNEISFSLFNDSGLLNEYGFGDFTATIGVLIGETSVASTGSIKAQSASHTYVASNETPYLLRDGNVVSSQPAAPIVSILIHNGTVYCRLNNGTIKAYNDSNGSVKSYTPNAFMLAQMAKWQGEGIFFGPMGGVNNMLRIWQGETLRTYEFVPLGKFNAERPNVPSVIEIDLTCNDMMQRFEIDMPSAADLSITYPCSIGQLFAAICNYADLPTRVSSFINSSATITKEPDDFKQATMREVLQWIAEAAASVARIDRDGYVVLDWVHNNTPKVIDEGKYSEFSPYWYETKQVTRLCNRASDGSYDNYDGSGDETYLIQDNPLLREVS